MSLLKSIVSGVLAAVSFFVLGILFDQLYPARMIWFAEQYQDMMVGNGAFFFFLSILVVGLAWGLIYPIIQKSIPGSGWRKGVNYGLMIFFVGGIMFPVMIMGYAPLGVAVAEIVFSAIEWIVAGVVVQWVHER
ncbi:MAG: hypothetical protein V1776_04985 [Candidatus Diapherotrites archaeon]